MAIENFYINGRQEDVISIFYYDESGNKCSQGSELAKVTTINGKDTYSLPFIGGELIDPVNSLFFQRNRKSWVFKSVSKKCFDSYISYLKNKRQGSFTTARRLINEPK